MKKGDCIFVHFTANTKSYLGKYVRRNKDFLIMEILLLQNNSWRTHEIPIINIKSIEHAPPHYCNIGLKQVKK